MISNNSNNLDTIEAAERETPFCVCGEPTVPASRADGIWLECVSLTATDSSRIGRLMSALVANTHTRQLILDVAA